MAEAGARYTARAPLAGDDDPGATSEVLAALLAGRPARCQYVANLDCADEIEVVDGTQRILGGGVTALGEDPATQRHIRCAVASQSRKSLFIIPEQSGGARAIA